MSHTPGPWFVERLQRTRRFAQHRNMTDPCRVLSKSDMIEVAVIDGIEDAELMAASPELLEACELLVAYISEPQPFTDAGMWEWKVKRHEAVAKANAAIKKARGEV